MSDAADTSRLKKHERTCVGCGAQKMQSQLFRIVRSKEGAVVFDGTGKMAGRGTYVCDLQCFEKAKERRAIARALKADVSQEDYERIAAQLKAAIDSNVEG